MSSIPSARQNLRDMVGFGYPPGPRALTTRKTQYQQNEPRNQGGLLRRLSICRHCLVPGVEDNKLSRLNYWIRVCSQTEFPRRKITVIRIGFYCKRSAHDLPWTPTTSYGQTASYAANRVETFLPPRRRGIDAFEANSICGN